MLKLLSGGKAFTAGTLKAFSAKVFTFTDPKPSELADFKPKAIRKAAEGLHTRLWQKAVKKVG